MLEMLALHAERASRASLLTGFFDTPSNIFLVLAIYVSLNCIRK